MDDGNGGWLTGTRYTSNPGTIIATGSAGKIKLQFTTDYSLNYAGFEATLSCISPVTWNGLSGNSNWNDAGNWSRGSVPGKH